jgi:hypothetical protein
MVVLHLQASVEAVEVDAALEVVDVEVSRQVADDLTRTEVIRLLLLRTYPKSTASLTK